MCHFQIMLNLNNSLINISYFRSEKGLEAQDYERWSQEMIGMREILSKFANISGEEIIGMRAPYLKPGRNAQYEVWN